MSRYTATPQANETIGKWSISSNVSDWCRDGPTPQLQAADTQPKIQERLKLLSSKWIRLISKWSWRQDSQPHPHYQIHRKGDIAKGRFKDVTYGTFVFSVRPEKKEKNRTRYAVGGNWTNYDGLVVMPTADMMVAKLLFNSVVSSIETIVLCSIKYRLRAQNSWQWTFPISISWLHFHDQNTYASASMAFQRRSSKSID